jgi:sensor domain CHASE-containing protein
MSLRKKTLITIGLTIVSLIVILYTTSRIILLGSFAALEEQNTSRNVEQALNALSKELSLLSATNGDWAAWDDTYIFIEDANEDYIRSNLVDGTFTTLRLNLMLFIHSSGRIVFGKAFDLQNEEEIPVPQSFQEHLSSNDLLLRHPSVESSVKGIILLSEDPMLISSRPILTSEDEGPIRGSLIIGRYLDSTEIERLAETINLSLTMCRFEDQDMPLDFQEVRSSLEEAPILVRPLNGESIAGYVSLKDIYGKPVLVLRVDMPRDIYEQGQANMRYFLLALLAVGLVYGVMTLLHLEKYILSRLARLSKSVSSIGASGDLSSRVAMAGGDELSSLADEINGMLEALEQSAEKLQHTTENLRKALGATIQAIALTVEAKDPYTAGHQRRVADLARAIATEMGLSEEPIDGIRMAGAIHDIGKISIPGEILSRPGRLSDIEFGLIKTHPQVGYDILKTIDFPWPVAQIVLQHHERMDGSGYPQGLSGEEIILEARILAVADVVEAMASYRPYRLAHSIKEALEEISQNRGVLYDPEVVDACLRLFIEKGFKVQSGMEDDNGDGTRDRSG